MNPARPTARRAAILTCLALAAPGLTLGSSPADAASPTGGAVELMFTQGPDYDTALTGGSFNADLFALPASGPNTPRANGCPARSHVAFAFTEASATPEQAGSAERPEVTPGATVADLFAWPAPGNNPDRIVYGLNPRSPIGAGEDVLPLDRRWPSGTRISIVAVCYTGSSDEPSEQPVVAGTDGHALTSWLQFTTVASPTDPDRTSAGFTIGEVKVRPEVSLSGADEAGRVRLTAAVQDDGATGRFDFAAVGGSTREPAGTAPVGPGGTGSILVDVPPVGAQTVYEATYVPDAAGGATYDSSTSRRYAVVGSPEQLPAEVVVSAPDTVYGKAGKVDVTVRRTGAPAGGQVDVSVDSGPATSVRLAAGRVGLTLPTTLRAGAHTVTARYAGTASTAPGVATGSFSVTPAAAQLEVKRKKRTKPPETSGKRSRTKLTVTVTGLGTALRPACTVQAAVGAKVVASGPLSADGTVVMRLPRFKAAKKRARVPVEVGCVGDPDFTVSTATIKVRVPGKGPR